MLEGNSLYRSYSRRKAKDPLKEAEEKLEESRRKNAEALAKGRREAESLKKERDEAAALVASKEAEVARLSVLALKANDAGETKKRAAEFAELSAAGDPCAAVAWYYEDKKGETQGPFSPQDMRAWFEAGYFPSHLRLRPVFLGDEDQRATVALSDLFDEPIAATAFLATKRKKRKTEPIAVTGHWLEDSVNRQKAGIHRKRHDRFEGPSMLFQGAGQA